MKGTHLGEFEELVLLTLCIVYKDAYGVAIRAELQKQSGRKVSISAVHAVLHRLEAKGLVKSMMGGATHERGGRRKRLFQITGPGRNALVKSRKTREKLWNLIPDFSFNRG